MKTHATGKADRDGSGGKGRDSSGGRGGRSGRRRPRSSRQSQKQPQPSLSKGPAPLSEEEILARLLYRDGLILIIDKPAGLPVHAGPGGGPNLEQCLDALRFGLPAAPALAHRLDRDTSGCLVLGRHRKALRKLGLMFAGGQVEKTYWAIVQGRPPETAGTIDLPLKKLNQRTGWRMTVAEKDDPEAQKAVTDYRLLGSDGVLSWLALKPRTGRTHQIRVHCTALGCPLIGDPVYGPDAAGNRDAGIKLHLHARAIGLPLYPKREAITAEAAPPPHMLTALLQCGYIAAEAPTQQKPG